MNDRPTIDSDAALVWLRDDLRLADNPALTAAADGGRPVTVLYVLEESPERRGLGGASRWWLHHSLVALEARLAEHGIPLVLRTGDAETVVPAVAAEAGAATVTWNRRYDRPSRTCDERIKATLAARGIRAESFNGHLLAEPRSVRTKTGDWFRVFTPFWKATQLVIEDLPQPLPEPRTLVAGRRVGSLGLADLDLLPTKPDWAGGLRATWTPGEAGGRARLADFLDERLLRYAAERDYPAAAATSELSPHIRFGEVSIRTIWHATRYHSAVHRVPAAIASKFLAELGWREFSYHLLFNFPDLSTRNFQPRFDAFPWAPLDEAALEAWKRGRTGFPIVDAGMRQLWTTGTMHNRVRMIVASFLVKHLLIDWRIGEDFFWDTLCDADVANNAAGWQWVAGSGADAAPYFRVFNPVLQGEKFDADGTYVKTFVPELAALPAALVHRPWDADPKLKRSGGRSYPPPIVDHQTARDRALAAFGELKTVA